jgi:hypothetical protein
MDSIDALVHEEHHDRVRAMTTQKVNQKLDRNTERRIHAIQSEGPQAIRDRLEELDKEWDIDRVLMLNFSVLVFAQLIAARKNPKWLLGPLIQTPFMFMHATLGWCPPSLWFRPMGFRTRKEIQAEREALLQILDQKRELQ